MVVFHKSYLTCMRYDQMVLIMMVHARIHLIGQHVWVRQLICVLASTKLAHGHSGQKCLNNTTVLIIYDYRNNNQNIMGI